MGYIKKTKSIFDLRDVKDDSFVGKDGDVLKVNEPRNKMELVPYTTLSGAPITLPEHQIRVSTDYGNDGSGVIGDFDLPFQTIFGAVEYARNLIVGDPTLKYKILINVEQGIYLDENDIIFDGHIHCEEGVDIFVGVGLAIFTGHTEGEVFQLTGFPNITGQVGGGIWTNTVTEILLSFSIEVNNISSFTTDVFYAEEMKMIINYLDWNNSAGYPWFNSVHLYLEIFNYVTPTFAAIYFMAAISSTKPHYHDINIHYYDGITHANNIYGFLMWAGNNDAYNTKTKFHIESGDNITGNFMALYDTSLTSSNILEISSNGFNTPNVLGDIGYLPNSKDINISGIWNCYGTALVNPISCTLKNLTLNALNDQALITSASPADIDVIGSLTLNTIAVPEYESNVTLNYISDLPDGGSSSSTIFVDQISHGFSVGDWVGNIGGVYYLADITDSNFLIIPAGVVSYTTTDDFNVTMGGIYDLPEGVNYLKGATYYMGLDGKPTINTTNLINIQSIFTVLEYDKIFIDIENLFIDEGGVELQSFIYEVTVSAGETVPTPFVDGYIVNVNIDWDDLSSSDITAWDDPNAAHTYTNAGTYEITISGWMQAFRPIVSSHITNIISWGNNGLKSLRLADGLFTTLPEDVFGGFKLMENFDSVFRSSNLTTIPENLFIHATECTSFQNTFFDCPLLTSIPAGLFANNIKVTGFSYTFRRTGITSIPSGLFANNINVTSATYAFEGCNSLSTLPSDLFDGNPLLNDIWRMCEHTPLTSIPNDLFANNPLLENVIHAFRSTNLTSLPSGLFANNPLITTFSQVFSNCMSLTTIPSDLFEFNVNADSFGGTFSNCTSLTTIPTGLFDNNTLATNFGSTFYNCTSLITVPSALFGLNTNVTMFTSTFENCTSLPTVPANIFNSINATSFISTFAGCTLFSTIPIGLFDNCPAVDSFFETFALTGITAPPSGLFDNNTVVTSFYHTFFDCNSLISIPSGLFDFNTLVTDIGALFWGCENLTTIPAGLFDSLTLLESFASTFQYCSSLTTIPSGLFDFNVNAIYFTYTFDRSGLTTIPTGLFDNNTLVIDFQNVFYSCPITTIPANLFDFNILANSFYNSFGVSDITAIPPTLFTNTIAAANFTYTFYTCLGITSVPSGLFDTCVDVTDGFTSTFEGCVNLTTIPSDLFDNNILMTVLYKTFQNTGLTSIPSGLFDYNVLLTTLNRTFDGCTSLTTIPSGLFDNLTLVNLFYGTFTLSGLTSIPSGLFDFNVNVDDFRYLFSACSSLTSIPIDLFDNTTSVSRFDYCFYDNTSLTGAAPELWVDYPTAVGTGCFENDTGLSNYAAIPVDWK